MNEVDFVAITFLSIIIPLYIYLIGDFLYGLIKKLRRRISNIYRKEECK